MSFMPSDTAAVLGNDAGRCESRSLLLDRFCDPTAEREARHRVFTRASGQPPYSKKATAWPGLWATSGSADRSMMMLHAQLQSRLIVNMAGGVMENAGLCLDRFGMPYIPGSAVKGCARRMAIQSLLELREAGENQEELSRRLAEIAVIFGWTEQDWSEDERNGRLTSDLAYAIGTRQWRPASEAVRKCLPDKKHFAGTVSFLPAWPVDAGGTRLNLRLPTLGKLELDVLTCHHPEYYGGKRAVALDDEDPIPVIFPTVAAGHVFTFILLPIRDADEARLQRARQWLAEGLNCFGLGAKTAAGYGWFDVSDGVQESVTQFLVGRVTAEAERKRAESEAASHKFHEEAALREREENNAAMASLTPEQQGDFRVAQLSDDQFRSAVDNFDRKTPEEQKSIIRALRLDPEMPDSRRGFWDELKGKAQKKGGKHAQTEQALRQTSKQMFPGKEGKMP